MKKSTKKLLVCGLVTAMTLSASLTALAGTWKQDHIGWWWQEDNGSYPVSTWKEISGKWYYFETSGYMAANKWIGNYYVGSDGSMLVNTTTPDGYRVGADGAWIPNTSVQNDSNQFQLNSQVTKFMNTNSYEEAISGLQNVSQEWSSLFGVDDTHDGISYRIIANNLPLTVHWAYHMDVSTYRPNLAIDWDAPKISQGLHEIYGMMNEVFDGLNKTSYSVSEIENLAKNIGAKNIKSDTRTFDGYLDVYRVKDSYVTTYFTLGEYEYFLDTIGENRTVYKPEEDQVHIRRIENFN